MCSVCMPYPAFTPPSLHQVFVVLALPSLHPATFWILVDICFRNLTDHLLNIHTESGSSCSVNPPTSPTVTVQSATASTILLTWSVPAGSEVDTYDIEWRSGGEMGTATTSGGTSAYTITDLDSATRYAIFVTASNTAGSARSSTVSAVTGMQLHTTIYGAMYHIRML